MDGNRILVLGLGNILLRDEGVGVRVIEGLQQRFHFSDNVELMDGGTLGLRLLDPILATDHLIIVDAVQCGEVPGTILRLDTNDIRKRISFKNSLHQVDLIDTLAYADLLGNCPRTVIIGIEPFDISPWGMELTATIDEQFENLLQKVLEEIKSSGGTFELLNDPRSASEP